VVRDGQEEWILDPLNPLQAADPFGAHSVAQGHGYQRPEWTLPDTAARPGTLEEIALASAALGDDRHVVVYVPARFRRSRRYPLLVVHDGPDFLRYANPQGGPDNRIPRLGIPPLTVAPTPSPELAQHDVHES